MGAQGRGQAQAEEGKQGEQAGRGSGPGQLDGHILTLGFFVAERARQAVQDGGEGAAALRTDAPASRQEAQPFRSRPRRQLVQILGRRTRGVEEFSGHLRVQNGGGRRERLVGGPAGGQFGGHGVA
jgi:hypothetical protein